MSVNYLVGFLAITIFFSCSKDSENDTYIVNATKMIGITNNSWSNVESQMRRKKGYRYTETPPNSGIKADVRVATLDDSNRVVNGGILLNISLDNRVQFAMLNTDPISQPAAYAMMLNYHHATLQSITGITSAIGQLVKNGSGGNPPVSTVLSKLTFGEIADQLGITYESAQGNFTMVLFRQPDGRFVFSYRGT